MCTNFALIKKPGITTLAHRLKVEEAHFLYSNDIRPGARISIVVERGGERRVRPALWWLYLQQTETGLKPHKEYFSVNTNHGNLGKKNEYKTSRCIIPATSFVESQDGKYPHLLEPADGSAIAFGGLWKEWMDKVTGEVTWSASIITLPGHPSLANIHRKSTPLWLPEDAYDPWLSEEVIDTAIFHDLLTPALRADLMATPIDKASTKNAVGVAITIRQN